MSAKVVGGKLVTRAKLPEGARVTVFVHDPVDSETLDDEAIDGISRGLDDHRAGRIVPATKLLAYLRRP